MNITDENFLLYAAAHYDNPSCYDTNEFKSDLQRIVLVKKHFKKYINSGEMKERLILNHLVVLYNVFGNEAATKMLVFRLLDQLPILRPFLMTLNRCPTFVTGIGFEDETIVLDNIECDKEVSQRLKAMG